MSSRFVIEGVDVSQVWARAFLQVSVRSGTELSPVLLTFEGITGGRPAEDERLRTALDACLEDHGLQSVDTVANTIFPQSLWRLCKGDRARLFREYLENLPSYVRMASAKNYRGLYFARMIAFDTDPKTGVRQAGGSTPEEGNQLEFIIKNATRKGARRSMAQSSIYDPARDMSRSAQIGFPCLQHVQFVPDSGAQTLKVNAFYATQQIFEKAYGNLLGLARLGAFMAHEMGRLTLERVSVFVGIEKMDTNSRPRSCASLSELNHAALDLVQRADAVRALSLTERK